MLGGFRATTASGLGCFLEFFFWGGGGGVGLSGGVRCRLPGFG